MSALDVLILGGGGREHALARAVAGSPRCGRVVVAPGNAGIAASGCACRAVDAADPAAAVALARELAPGLVIVGPELPLRAGVANALRAAGFPVFGPDGEAARLESSKVFAKDFLERHGIPTARAASFRALAPALAYLESHPLPVVVKASGLAAGKGVIIAATAGEAESAVRAMLERRSFGEAGDEIVIEEFLAGEEVSVLALVAGTRYALLPASQDHKRVGEGDTGPNTGGMGAYAPASIFTPEVEAEVRRTILEPTLAALVAEGLDYRGTLYAGLMLTADGPKVLEYNCRFGDPETQAVLPLVESDLLEWFLAAAHGTLPADALRVRGGASVCVVLAAENYPEAPRLGDAVELPAALPEGVSVLAAGLRAGPDGVLRTAGGRVLAVQAAAPALEDALALAYPVCEALRWPGCHFRRDIAHRELARRRR